MTDTTALAQRLADYGLTLYEHEVICDRRVVDESVTALATLTQENAELRAEVDRLRGRSHIPGRAGPATGGEA